MSGAAPGDQLEPGDPLLRGLDEVCAGRRPVRAGDCDRVAPHLADRLGRPGEPLRMVVDHPVATEDPAGLLVGEEDHGERSRRASTGPGQVPDAGQDHGVHVLHVDRTPAPQAAIAFLRPEGVDAPVRSGGGDDVEVTVDDQTRADRIGTLETEQDAGAARGALDKHGVQPDLLQLPHDVLGRGPLPRAGSVAGVRRVDPQQVAAQPGGVILERGSRHVGQGMSPPCRLGGRPPCVLSFRGAHRTGDQVVCPPRPGGGMADALA